MSTSTPEDSMLADIASALSLGIHVALYICAALASLAIYIPALYLVGGYLGQPLGEVVRDILFFIVDEQERNVQQARIASGVLSVVLCMLLGVFILATSEATSKGEMLTLLGLGIILMKTFVAGMSCMAIIGGVVRAVKLGWSLSVRDKGE